LLFFYRQNTLLVHPRLQTIGYSLIKLLIEFYYCISVAI